MSASRADRIELRCRCTGETPNMVRRQLTADPGPLIPDATTWIQHVLEMQMLFAAQWANYKRHKDHVKSITSIRPAHDLLCLTVTAEAAPIIVGYFLSPASKDKGVHVRPNQHHIEIQLRDPFSDHLARIRLLNHSRKSWQSLKKAATCPELTNKDIRQDWHTTWDTSVLDVDLTFVSSAALRRLRLWKDARSFRINGGPDAFIDWSGELSADTIERFLTSPPCRSPEVAVNLNILPPLRNGRAVYFKVSKTLRGQYSTERIQRIADHWVSGTRVETK
jgi:hypothetical protein